MKYAVIDVGSNSVRLMLWENKTLFKEIICTRLAENMADGKLNKDSVLRTARAVSFFAEKAEKEGAGKIFIFGTAALRKAKNAETFTEIVKNDCGIAVDVISGEKEAEIGALGALGSNDGGVIDVGGASAEIVVFSGGKAIYEKSADVGAVSLKDACGEDERKAKKYIAEKTAVYKDVPKADFFAIGGTATSLAAISQGLKVYDPKKVHGYVLSINEVKRLKDLRAEIIPMGANILYSIMEKYAVNSVTVSESDNLEGYLFDRLKNEKKN